VSFWDRFESNRDGIEDTVEFTIRIAVMTLAMVMVAVVSALMFGLFHKDVDNSEIFALIGPAFNTIVGAFVGLLGGLSLNANARDKSAEPAPVEPEPDPEVGEFNPVPLVRPTEPEADDDDDDDMAPWEKYRNDLRYDANGDGVVDEDDFPDWRNPGA
jgi:hypothetical protein